MNISEYPNGAIIFCSETVSEAVHPPNTLPHRVYSCGRHFETTLLREQLKAESAPDYGIIVIDGADACIGTSKGLGASSRSAVVSLARLSSTTASKTRRGGSSASRYSRLRVEADLSFLRCVAERAAALLAGVRGIVLAGKADAKARLLPELSRPLQSRVLCSVNLPCDASIDGLRLAASCVGHVFASDLDREKNQALSDFMDLVHSVVGTRETRVCYGKTQTMSALRLGAIETLLLGEDEDVETWKVLADEHGTHIIEVGRRSEQSVQFCNSFNVGGCLRWPVDPNLLEEEGLCDDDTSAGPGDAISVHVEVASLSTNAPSEVFSSTRDDLDGRGLVLDTKEHVDVAEDASAMHTYDTNSFDWLEDEITDVFGDRSTAQAVVAGVEAILGDESSDENDAMANVVEMLIGEGVPQHIIEKLARAQ